MNPTDDLKELIKEGKQIVNPNTTKTNFLNWSDNVKTILKDSYGETSKAFQTFSSSSSAALDLWFADNHYLSENALKGISDCIEGLGEIVEDITFDS